MGDNYEGMYAGGYSSLSPNYGNFIGYRLGAGQIGSPTSIQTANQIGEVISRIREGVRNVELQPLQQDVFEQIPKEHFKEIAALSKLTGVKPSLHSPIVDPVGFGERGWEGEFARKDAEQKLLSVVEKGYQLDPTGNTPIVIHSSAGIPGTEYRPGDTKKGEKRFVEKKLILIDQESKQMVPIEEERKYYLSTKEEDFAKGRKEGLEFGGTLRKPRDEIESLNRTDWDQKITGLATGKKQADEVMGTSSAMLAEYLDAPMLPQYQEKMTPQEKFAAKKLIDADLFLDNVEQGFTSIFNRAYKYGTDEQREQLEKLSKDYQDQRKKLYVAIKDEDGNMGLVPTFKTPLKRKEVIENVILGLKQIADQGGAPQVYKPVEEFAMEKAADTFGNVAFKSYKQFKDNAPILAIENMYQGMAFSRAEDMNKLIEDSRKKFVGEATKPVDKGGLGMAENEAKSQAQKLIGVNWDVGHVNIMRKHGFTEQDVINETNAIARNVKHIHLTDNFGFTDSHLPPGMGNVPIKKILEELKNAGTLQKSRAIVEAGTFVQHFKKSPHPFTLSAFGSPVYGGSGSTPYWNQVTNTPGGYFGMPMAYLPEKHFSMYGTGFSMLPEELGGQIPGTQSRFSGTPNS